MPFGSVRRMRTRIGLLVQPKSMRWENDVFVFGSKLTLASLGDLQWHLFGIMLMPAVHPPADQRLCRTYDIYDLAKTVLNHQRY